MPKNHKIDREYLLTDDSVNVYGFRCLTAGLLLDEVKKNPIGFKMHNRENGVVVRWEDFRLDGDKVYAKPVLNMAHPDAERTVSEVENSFLNAASVGKIVCLEASDDIALMLPGQTGATITKWFPREISLVDIPGNYNALANLVDANGDEINLADFVKPKNTDMSKNILLAATVLATLNLSDNSSQEEFNAAIQDLADKANQVPKLTQDLADMTEKHTATKTELDDLKAETTAAAVADLIAAGTESKKITVETGKKLASTFAADPKGLKDLIDSMPAQTLVTDDLKDKTPMSEFAGKTFDDLYVSGKLQAVKDQYPDLYEKLRTEKNATK